MIDRRLLLLSGAAVAAVVGLRWLDGSDVEAAGTFEIDKSDSEWRRILTKPQYEVLRLHHTEIPGSSPLNQEKRKGIFGCAACDLPLFSSRDEIRQRDRLAELLSAAAECGRHPHRPRAADPAHRGALPALRRASRPRVFRRAAADRAALLHERRRDEVCPDAPA